MTIKTSKFKGEPMYRSPSWSYLDGNFGKDVLKEYIGRVNKDYNVRASRPNPLKTALKNTWNQSNKSGIISSNPFSIVLINKIISGGGLRTASIKDLYKLGKEWDSLKDNYVDVALALTNGTNNYLGKNLLSQLGRLDSRCVRESCEEQPILLNLNSLDLVKDSRSRYGLSFRIKKDIRLDDLADNNLISVMNKQETFSPEENGFCRTFWQFEKGHGLQKKIGITSEYCRDPNKKYEDNLTGMCNCIKIICVCDKKIVTED